MTDGSSPIWYREPDELDDLDLRMLLEAAASVLTDTGDGGDVEPVSELAPGVVAADLSGALAAEGVQADTAALRELIETASADRRLALAFVHEVCALPQLRDEIDAAYEARRRMMVVEPATLLAASLLLLVIKLRRVRVGRAGVEIRLDPIKAEMVTAVKQLLREG